MKKFILISTLILMSLNIQAQHRDKIDHLRKLQMAEYAISTLYVDEIDEKKIVEAAIISMLEQLDPHSTYSDLSETRKLNEPLQGNFEGIGIQFQMLNDTLLVIQPITGGPSEKAGILPGDRILAVNSTTIAGVNRTTDEIMSMIRGPKGSKIDLVVSRRNLDKPINFRVKRDKIPIHSIDAAYMLDKRIGYIRINRFGEFADKEFHRSLVQLKEKGMRNLVLDLQGNGGGYLKTAVNIANDFLCQDELILYTKGRTAGRENYYAKGNGKFQKGRLVVLIDEYSASASEIVAGAVQDWDRGLIVGRRSYGKGLVQRPIELIDGSMLRLTVSRYYTPSGRCIQKPYSSIEPTTTNDSANTTNVAENIKNYHRDLINRYNNGELTNADSIHFTDSLKYFTRKLQRTIYGKGGIMPDFFVPIDTTQFTDYHRNLVAKGIIIKFVTEYIEKNREELQEKFRLFKTFQKSFMVSDDILANLQRLGEEDDIAFNQKQFTISKPLIKNQLKAIIARDLWGPCEYFQVINEQDNTVLAAIQILKDGTYEKKLPKFN